MSGQDRASRSGVRDCEAIRPSSPDPTDAHANPNRNAAQPVVRCTGVSKAFGKKGVLTQVSLDVPEGRVVGILGRNGEGKTTLFRILLDMVAADAGTVQVLGRRADGSGRIREVSGYVPERPTFHAFHTVAQVLDLRRRLFPTWDDTRAARTVKELGLDANTKIQGASKGTLAKLAWVCATAHNPKVLILDEPTSGLDALVRDEVLGHLVKEMADEGRTILVANHRMEELSGVLDEVRPLHGGVLGPAVATDALRQKGRRLAVRVNGTAPQVAGLHWLPGDGDLRHAVALDGEAVARAAAAGISIAEEAPLMLEDAFRALLGEEGGRS